MQSVSLEQKVRAKQSPLTVSMCCLFINHIGSLAFTHFEHSWNYNADVSLAIYNVIFSSNGDGKVNIWPSQVLGYTLRPCILPQTNIAHLGLISKVSLNSTFGLS